MTQHDDSVRLRHMLEAAETAVRLANGKQRSDLKKDEVFVLAITRLLEILGEAANHVSADIQEANPNIPWREVIGVRNHLIHGYFDVDLDIIWQILSKDLPQLIKEIRNLLNL